MSHLRHSERHLRAFGGLFIRHDLSEAARIVHRIAVPDRQGRGIGGTLSPPGPPGSCSEAQIFDFVEAARADTMLAGLVNVDERALSLDCACDMLGVRECC